MLIREELAQDIESIYELNKEAFETEAEAKLVNKLREDKALILSLVALDKEKVVGHIAFSLVTIENRYIKVEALGLAPMAVSPVYQRQGIGSKLIEKGLALLLAKGYTRVVVLGHPEYYLRFGFEPAKNQGIRWEHDCPEEAFMVKELSAGAFDNVSGVVKFRPEFNEV